MTDRSPVRSATDDELLADYVRSRSSDAFGELVARYVGMVHAAALRQTTGEMYGDVRGAAHLAEDVTQAVFITLSKRAATIRAGSVLVGWLLLTTRYAARNATRHERRLKQRERKVARVNSEAQQAEAKIESLDGEMRSSLTRVLDDAIAGLGARDRDAILLRFFQSKTHAQIGALLGLSESAAAKRVSRALLKLRALLDRAGVSASEAMLGATLPTLATHAAPSALIASIHGGTGGAASASASASAIANSLGRSRCWLAPTLIATLVLLASVWAALAFRGMVAPSAARSATQALAQSNAVAAINRSPGVTIVVLDPATNAPIADALVEFRDDTRRSNEGRTDANGRFVLQIPERYDFLHIELTADGRVPMGMDWQNRTFRGALPQTVIVPMEKGVPMGGVVRDATGKPVSGAAIALHFMLAYGNAMETPTPLYAHADIVTDEEGRWRIENGPRTFDGQISINVPGRERETWGNADANLDELKRFASVETLSDVAGRTAAGTVLDGSGKPVAGATVVSAWSDRDKRTTETDSLGRFALRDAANVLTITAGGFAPELVRLPEPDVAGAVDAGVAYAPVTIRPLKSLPFSARVVLAADDQPLDHMRVQIASWRGCNTLSSTFTTDNDGRFAWTDAPADDVTLAITDPQHHRAARTLVVHPGTATTQPVTIVAYAPLHIVGTVIDADTREPIPKFTVMHGIRSLGDWSVVYHPHAGRTLVGGRFSATLDDVEEGAKLQVQAEGYVPAESRLLTGNDAGDLVLSFELSKGNGASGNVIDVDGKPAIGQHVYFVSRSASFMLSDRYEAADQPGFTSGKTDDAGRFRFTPSQADAEDFEIVVYGEHGFAIATKAALHKDPRITLQPYARVEGALRIGTKLAADANLAAFCALPLDQAKGTIEVSTITGPDGKFAFHKVPPGLVCISRAINGPAGSTRYVPLQTHRVNAGETVSVQLGGRGRPVVAKLIAPPAVQGPIDVGGLYCKTVRIRPGALKRREALPYPANFPDLNTDDQAAWWTAFYKTDDGKRFRERERLEGDETAMSPMFIPNPDGTIRADDVNPGTYHLTLTLMEPFDPHYDPHRVPKDPATLGSAEVTFDVPAEHPAPPSDELLHLDPIPLLPVDMNAPIDPLSKLHLLTPDGAPLKLLHFRGKFVIVHLWSMNHTALVPALRRVRQTQPSEKLQIINVCVNTLPRWAKHISDRERMPGLLTLDEDTYNGDGPRLYDDMGIGDMEMGDGSYAYLISPDGKLLTFTDRPDELEKSVADACR